MRRLFTMWGIGLALAGLSHAEEVSLTARVDRSDIALGETLTLQLTLSGERAPDGDWVLPSLDGFHVVPAGRSQNFSFVNGAVTRETIFTYLLTPRAPGTHTLPPFTLAVKGRTLSTPPIVVTVRAGSAGPPAAAPGPRPGESSPPSGGEDLFITATLDKKSAVVGEALTLHVRFYNRVALMGQPHYQAPHTEGFLAEETEPQRQYPTTLNGHAYQVVELTTVLFPRAPGRARVGPATLECVVRGRPRGAGGFPSFFDDFFASGRRVVLRSEPLEIDIQPLPTEGRPAAFRGAVGRYRITARLDKSQAGLHEPVSLVVAVEGEGNIKALPDPVWPALEGFKKYETLSNVTVGGHARRRVGAKVFTTVLKPEVSGDLTIPPLRYPFYEPGVGYREVATPSLRLTVAGEPAVTPGGEAVAGGVGPPEGARELTAEIRYIHVNASPRRTPGPWRRHRAFQWLLGGPWLLLAWVWLLRVLRARGFFGRFSAGPARRAKAGLARAAALVDDPARRLTALHRVFLDYLGQRLAVAPSGLTLTALRGEMRARGFSDETVQRTVALWERFDRERFTPGGSTRDEADRLAQDLTHCLESMEKGGRAA